MSPLPNLRHLRAVVAAGRLGGPSAAARELHVSQPAVTQGIAALEREFGAEFFLRTPRGSTPTLAGELFLNRALRALQCLQEGLAELDRSVAGSVAARFGRLTAAQLAALVAVTEAGGFGSAARANGLARATVHRAARQLELALGTTLYEQTSHGVRANRDGERLARRVQLAAAELAQARAELAALRGEERGRTVVGAMPLARSALVPRAVLRFAERHPGHVVSILDGPYEAMLQELRAGHADVLLGALRESVPADVVQEALFDDPLAIIVRRGHPLAGAVPAGRAPPLAALAKLAWVAPRPGSPLRRQFDELCPWDPRTEVPAPIECNSLVAARALLLASDRALLLSAQQVAAELASGELVALAHPFGRVVRRIGLTVRRDWLPTGAQRALLAELRAVAADARDAQTLATGPSKPSRSRKARGDTPMRRVKKRVK